MKIMLEYQDSKINDVQMIINQNKYLLEKCKKMKDQIDKIKTRCRTT